MKLIFVLLLLSFPIYSGCAYTSHTIMTLKAKDAKAIVSAVPVGVEEGRILMDRKMHWCMFQRKCKSCK